MAGNIVVFDNANFTKKSQAHFSLFENQLR
jgi:hypothetical protein